MLEHPKTREHKARDTEKREKFEGNDTITKTSAVKGERGEEHARSLKSNIHERKTHWTSKGESSKKPMISGHNENNIGLPLSLSNFKTLEKTKAFSLYIREYFLIPCLLIIFPDLLLPNFTNNDRALRYYESNLLPLRFLLLSNGPTSHYHFVPLVYNPESTRNLGQPESTTRLSTEPLPCHFGTDLRLLDGGFLLWSLK